jgi:hypothetical protein
VDVDQSPEQKGESPSRDISLKEKETNNVGEVRRKVQEMTWKEGQPKPSAEGEEKKDEATSPVKTSKEGDAGVGKKKVEQGEEEGGKDLKRKSIDRNESSILEPLSPKRIKETPSVCPLSLSFFLIQYLS